jgi:hypothetical protein
MTHVTPRSALLPHNSFIIRNSDRERSITIRFIETTEYNGQSAFRCHYSEENEWTSSFEEIKDYAFEVNYPSKKEYILKPCEAVTVTVIGGLRPPEGLGKECLLKAVSLPEHNFLVQPLKVKINFEYVMEGSTTWRQDTLQICSTYTKQLPQHKCAFVFNVTVSTDPVELIRCCPHHSPIYSQNVFPYFPHGGKIPITQDRMPTCTCCL